MNESDMCVRAFTCSSMQSLAAHLSPGNACGAWLVIIIIITAGDTVRIHKRGHLCIIIIDAAPFGGHRLAER